jgi:hypothetical protein
MLNYFILIFTVLMTSSCSAQDPNKELKNLYPKAKKVEWESDRNGNREAHYKLNGSHYRSDFTPAGKWIETERSIEWKDLPPAVQYTVKKHADKDEIVELEEVHHHKKGWFYDVEVEKKKKGKRDLVIAPDGQLIDKEEWK